MKIYSVYDPEFKPYGKVLTGYDTAALVDAMGAIALPEAGTAYEPAIDSLEACAIFEELRDHAYGGMPIEIGMCWGYNTRLNCFEYHRDSELNIGWDDYILLVARQDEIVDGVLDSGKVKAFRAPKGAVVEVYATTLHYAPCQAVKDKGFRVAIALPRGTNGKKPVFEPKNEEDKWLFACNKWLLAHPDTSEARNGAHIGIAGENIDISELI